MKKPNILFFFTDQQRWDTIGAYGQKLPITPNIDKMASQGTIFENAFTCQPVCGPARACLQTGLYATQTGNIRNDVGLPEDRKLLAHYMSEAGYETAYIGKWHLASDRKSNRILHTVATPPEYRGGYNDYWMAADALEHTSHGYDGYVFDKDMNKVEFKGYRADCLTDFAIEYLDNRDNEKPFFLMLSFLEPHHQNDHNAYEGPNGSKEKYENYDLPLDLADTDGDWRENFPDYLGCCASLDYNFGRIMSKLKKLNLDDNTIIIYSSDHGSHFRTRNSEYKRSGHESSIHVPLIMWGGGFNSGKKIKSLVSLLDIPPTILQVAGVEIPKDYVGESVQKLLTNDSDWRNEIFIQVSESSTSRVIRTDEWKYSMTSIYGFQDVAPLVDEYKDEFLYNLKTDPAEKSNLVFKDEFRGIKQTLRKKLLEHMDRIGEATPKILEL